MKTSKLAPLSVFGLIGRSVQIYFSNPLKFLWYALPPVVLGLAIDLGGGLWKLAFLLFFNSFFLFEGWMVYEAASFYVKKDDGQHVGGAESKITAGSTAGRALACLQVLYVLRNLGNGRSALLRLAIDPLLSLLTAYWPMAIVIEGKPFKAAAKRSASIASQTIWTLLKLQLAFFIFVLCASAVVGLLWGLGSNDFGVDPDTFEQQMNEYAEPIGGVLAELLFIPILHIATVALYLQYRSEKEGLTTEILTQELAGVVKNTTESTDFVHVVNEQTHSNVPSLEGFHND